MALFAFLHTCLTPALWCAINLVLRHDILAFAQAIALPIDGGLGCTGLQTTTTMASSAAPSGGFHSPPPSVASGQQQSHQLGTARRLNRQLQGLLTQLRAVNGAWSVYLNCASLCCVAGGFCAMIVVCGDGDGGSSGSTAATQPLDFRSHMAVLAVVESLVLLVLLGSGGATTSLLAQAPLRQASAMSQRCTTAEQLYEGFPHTVVDCVPCPSMCTSVEIVCLTLVDVAAQKPNSW